MRKLLLLIPLLLLAAPPSFGSRSYEFSLFGPVAYRKVRANVADRYVGMFPGIEGQATLTVQAPGAQGNPTPYPQAGRTGITVTLNGDRVLMVPTLQSGRTYRVPVAVRHQNLLEITFGGNRGNRIVVDVSQSVDAEAAAMIGDGGGVVEVTDAASPFAGLSVLVPQGALAQGTIVAVRTAEADELPPLPDSVDAVGPVLALEASSSFIQPVVSDVPFPDATRPERVRVLFSYDRPTESWVPVAPVPSADHARLRFLTSDLTIYRWAEAVAVDTRASTGFDVGRDSHRFRNDFSTHCPEYFEAPGSGGVGMGMTLLAQAYYLDFPPPDHEGLRCHWGLGTDAAASCEAHALAAGPAPDWAQQLSAALFAGLSTAPGMAQPVFDHTWVLDYIKYELAQDRPVPLAMIAFDGVWTPCGIAGAELACPELSNDARSTLATGFRTASPFAGTVDLYDVVDNEQLHELTWSLPLISPTGRPILLMSYAPGDGPPFNVVVPASARGIGVDQVVTAFPAERICE